MASEPIGVNTDPAECLKRTSRSSPRQGIGADRHASGARAKRRHPRMDGPTAFLTPGGKIRIEGRPGGPLEGLHFVAKDLFHVAVHPTGAGNHDWMRTHPVPARHAWAVQTLLDAGAALTGKTITDEISLGILGENAFDGTPLN